uniref:Nucleic acid dioxygenase ALKB n=1 Tax=Lingulaulax polyedra TaxID=160621 RepID=A0A516AG50_LINPO|nr:nucleic acid dioxygenase ALKB [Lingulodinium polyedra]
MSTSSLPDSPASRSMACEGRNMESTGGRDVYGEVEALWRRVRDYESLCQGAHASAAWRLDLLEEPKTDPRCIALEGSPVEAYAVKGTAAGDGVFVCPGALAIEQQQGLLFSLLTEWALPPNRSNLWPSPSGGEAKAEAEAKASVGEVLRQSLAGFLAAGGACAGACASASGSGALVIERLRWVTLGQQYNWATRAYLPNGEAPPLPQALRALAEAAAAAVPLPPGAAVQSFEAAICNLYHAARRPSDRLGGHRDDVEPEAASPLVGLSLGLPCVFLLGGEARSARPTPLLLRGGSVLVLAGAARHAVHGVPTVLVPPRLQLRGRVPRPSPPGALASHAGVYCPWAPGEAGEGPDQRGHLAAGRLPGLEAVEEEISGLDGPQRAALQWLLTRARVSFSIRSVGR